MFRDIETTKIAIKVFENGSCAISLQEGNIFRSAPQGCRLSVESGNLILVQRGASDVELEANFETNYRQFLEGFATREESKHIQGVMAAALENYKAVSKELDKIKNSDAYKDHWRGKFVGGSRN